MYSSEYYIICLKYKPISNKYLKIMFNMLKIFNKNSFNKRIQKKKYPKYFKYQLTKALSFISEIYLINRLSNNTNMNTNAFRSYTNNYIGFGINYKF